MSSMQDLGAMPPPPEPPAPPEGLFRGVPPRHLTLGSAIEVAFRALGKPALLIPIMVIAIVVNAVTEVILGPSTGQLQAIANGTTPTVEELNQLLGALGAGLLFSLVGGMIAAIYGTVWAVAASIGPAPTVSQALALAGRRGPRVLGASLLVAVIMLGLLLAGGIIVAGLSQASAAIGFGLAVALLVALVWFVARLSMTSWLAADGTAVMASLRTSWRITEGSVMRIVGWTFVYGLLFALVAGAAGIVLGRIPYVGQGVAQGLTLVLGYGAGVTLFRRTQASAPPPAPEPAATVHETPIG
jgi:hypothetical protein